MSDQETLALRALSLRLLADRVKTADNQNRAQIGASFATKDRKVAWLDLDGRPTEIGHVRIDPGSVTASVTDMQALIDWCETNAPGEVYEPPPVTQVRSSFVTALLERAKKAGAPVTDEGEVIPGITVRTGDPRTVVKPAGTNEAEAALMAAIVADPHALGSLLGELAGGTE